MGSSNQWVSERIEAARLCLEKQVRIELSSVRQQYIYLSSTDILASSRTTVISDRIFIQSRMAILFVFRSWPIATLGDHPLQESSWKFIDNYIQMLGFRRLADHYEHLLIDLRNLERM
jgi:hypothetical protein